MIYRELSQKLLELFGQFPVLGIMGPRQSGKTTLVKQTFPSLPYCNLENLDTRDFARSDPRAFLNMYPEGMIIDEAQHVPELFSYIQSMSDQKNKPGLYILTGSQNFLLHEKVSQSLAGRIALTTLLPLSLKELKNHKNYKDDSHEMIFQGFYPRVLEHQIHPTDWYPNYIATYIEKDVRQIKNITNLSLFQKFLKLCAGRTGQLLNLSSLAQDCGISHVTARQWLSLLEASYIIFLLKPHHLNFNKRLVKTPKLYFCDPGLACSLLDIHDPKQLQTHYLRGALFENLMILEMMKKAYNMGRKPNLYFWRDKIGHEIDCLIEESGQLVPIEIKSGQTINSDYFEGLNYWNKLSGQSNGYIIYGGRENQQRSTYTILSWEAIDQLRGDSS